LWGMMLFRKSYVMKVFVLFAGITFLNLSFILAEFSAIGLGKDSAVIQNLINWGFEEEQESSSEGETDSETEFLISPHHDHAIILFAVTQSASSLRTQQDVRPGHLTNFSPPPEV
jgi:hypothetical protein